MHIPTFRRQGRLTAQVYALWLIRESDIDTKRRVHEAAEPTILLREVIKFLHIRIVKGDEFAVFVDAGGRDGLGEDGGVAGNYEC